jgi:hypothetical protein
LAARYITFYALVLFCGIAGKSQQAALQTDVRSSGMGSPLATLPGIWSGTTNPAGLATITTPSFGLFYKNYYGLKELGTGSFAFCIPTKTGNFGFGFVSSGFVVITESQATISYGRWLGNRLRAGIGMHWIVFNQPSDYRDLFAWIPSAGIQWLPVERFVLAFCISNPASQDYNPSGYREIPATICAGAGFRPSDDFFMLFEVHRITRQKLKYVLGFEAAVSGSFKMRFGINRQDYATYSFGAGYTSGKITIDAGAGHHPVMGFSPSFGLAFAI